MALLGNGKLDTSDTDEAMKCRRNAFKSILYDNSDDGPELRRDFRDDIQHKVFSKFTTPKAKNLSQINIQGSSLDET